MNPGRVTWAWRMDKREKTSWRKCLCLINRPSTCNRGCSTNSFVINWFTDPFPQNLINIITPKPEILRQYSPPPVSPQISHVICHISRVTCHMSHDIITPKLLELGTWNYETTFATSCVSRVTCYVPHVACHVLNVTFHNKIYIYFILFHLSYLWS